MNLRELLPDVISDALAAGLRTFGKRMPRYLDPDAILIAPESRTSSPVRIPRDRAYLMHPDVGGCSRVERAVATPAAFCPQHWMECG